MYLAKFYSALLVLSTIALVPAQAQEGATIADGEAGGPILSLSVTGNAVGKPDRAILSAYLNSIAPTATVAMEENAKKINAVLKILHQLGEERAGLETSRVSVNEEFRDNGNKRTSIGFSARNNLSVTIKDFDNIGKILDTLSKLKAKNVSGPEFAIHDDKALIKISRENAIREATEVSQFYAKSVGYDRAQLISISESDGYSSRFFKRSKTGASRTGGSFMPGSDSTTAEAADVEHSLSISAKYRLVRR